MIQSSPAPAPNPAQTYEEHSVAHQFRPWGNLLVDHAKPEAGERVLDVACGTGIVARLIAQRLKGQVELVALDPSPLMLEVARVSAAKEGVEISFHEGRAEALPFEDGSFDLVTIQQGLQYFLDKAAGLGEIHRVLAPSGRVASVTWTEIENHPYQVTFADVVQRHLGTPAVQTAFVLGDREKLYSHFAEAGFEYIDITVVRRDATIPSPSQFLELSVTGVAAAIPAMQSMSADERQTLIDAVKAEMAEPLQRFIHDDQVILPFEAHIVVARKSLKDT